MGEGSNNPITQIIVTVVGGVLVTVILAQFGLAERFTNNTNNSNVGPNNGPTQQPPPTQSRTDITIMYGGDLYNCMLPITIQVGDQSLIPNGNSVVMRNVPIGMQPYSISGQINCAAIGSCVAQGSGTINVQPHTTFQILWSNTGYGQCNITLSR